MDQTYCAGSTRASGVSLEESSGLVALVAEARLTRPYNTKRSASVNGPIASVLHSPESASGQCHVHPYPRVVACQAGHLNVPRSVALP